MMGKRKSDTEAPMAESCEGLINKAKEPRIESNEEPLIWTETRREAPPVEPPREMESFMCNGLEVKFPFTVHTVLLR